MATVEPVPASEVRAGDVLALPGRPQTTVTGIQTHNLLAGQGSLDWPALHIQGLYNIIRFPHELVFRVVTGPATDPEGAET